MVKTKLDLGLLPEIVVGARMVFSSVQRRRSARTASVRANLKRFSNRAEIQVAPVQQISYLCLARAKEQ
jgi:hypothetical protein